MHKYVILLMMIMAPGNTLCRLGYSTETLDKSPHLLAVNIEGKWGLIDLNGKIAIPAQYCNKLDFSEGLAAVCLKGLWGFIDLKGSFVLNPCFHEARNFKNGYAAVRSGTKWYMIDRKGVPAGDMRFDEIGDVSEGMFSVRVGDIHGYVDVASGKNIAGTWDHGSEFSSGLAKVSLGHLIGFIDSKGRMIIKPRYSPGSGSFRPGIDLIPFAIITDGDITRLSDGTPLGRINRDRYGFIGRSGGYVIPPIFSYASDFHEGLAGIASDRNQYDKDEFGFVDTSGKAVIPPQFDWVGNFSESMAVIKSGSRYGFIDKKGAIVVKPEYQSVGDFHHGLARVEAAGMHGFVNKQGTYQVPLQFTELGDFDGEAAYYEKEGEYGYLDRSGRKIWTYQTNKMSKAQNQSLIARIRLLKSYKQGRYELGGILLLVALGATAIYLFRRWFTLIWIYVPAGCLVFLIAGYGMINWGFPKIEASEWEHAKALNASDAFKRYLSDWPRGKYAEDVQNALVKPISLPYKGKAKGERASASGSFAFSGTSRVAPGSWEHAVSSFIPVGEDLVMEGTLSQFELNGVIIDLESTSYDDGVVHTKYFGDLKCKLDKFTPSEGTLLDCSCSLEQSEALHEFIHKQMPPRNIKQ